MVEVIAKRKFPYSEDGITTRNIEAGERFECRDDLVEGLKQSGDVEDVSEANKGAPLNVADRVDGGAVGATGAAEAESKDPSDIPVRAAAAVVSGHVASPQNTGLQPIGEAVTAGKPAAEAKPSEMPEGEVDTSTNVATARKAAAQGAADAKALAGSPENKMEGAGPDAKGAAKAKMTAPEPKGGDAKRKG
jgi:hypothetical protein